jgi:CheY-like chemotaxis protein
MRMKANAEHQRTVLWVDDDGPQRFLYEEFVLTRSNWDTRWANSVEEAMEQLRNYRFDSIIVDQCVPLLRAGWTEDAWGGCRLLYWLRELYPPPRAPESRVLDNCIVGKNSPLEANRKLRVIVSSAFFDNEIDTVIRSLPGEVYFLQKPISPDRLKKYFC